MKAKPTKADDAFIAKIQTITVSGTTGPQQIFGMAVIQPDKDGKLPPIETVLKTIVEKVTGQEVVEVRREPDHSRN